MPDSFFAPFSRGKREGTANRSELTWLARLTPLATCDCMTTTRTVPDQAVRRNQPTRLLQLGFKATWSLSEQVSPSNSTLFSCELGREEAADLLSLLQRESEPEVNESVSEQRVKPASRARQGRRSGKHRVLSGSANKSTISNLTKLFEVLIEFFCEFSINVVSSE